MICARCGVPEGSPHLDVCLYAGLLCSTYATSRGHEHRWAGSYLVGMVRYQSCVKCGMERVVT